MMKIHTPIIKIKGMSDEKISPHGLLSVLKLSSV